MLAKLRSSFQNHEFTELKKVLQNYHRMSAIISKDRPRWLWATSVSLLTQWFEWSFLLIFVFFVFCFSSHSYTKRHESILCFFRFANIELCIVHFSDYRLFDWYFHKKQIIAISKRLVSAHFNHTSSSKFGAIEYPWANQSTSELNSIFIFP